MKNFLQTLKTKEDLQRTIVFSHGSVITHMMGLFFYLIFGQSPWLNCLFLALVAFFYRSYIRTIKNLYYTYWTFSIAFGVLNFLLFWSAFFSRHSEGSYFYLLSIILNAIGSYMVFSPIFYPRVSWWEYDFRYREDLKAYTETDNYCFECRISDIRREAACLVAFEDMDLGQEILCKLKLDNGSVEIKGRVLSKREYLIGRGFTYGIKFVLEENKAAKDYETLKEFARNNKQQKKQLKILST